MSLVRCQMSTAVPYKVHTGWMLHNVTSVLAELCHELCHAWGRHRQGDALTRNSITARVPSHRATGVTPTPERATRSARRQRFVKPYLYTMNMLASMFIV